MTSDFINDRALFGSQERFPISTKSPNATFHVGAAPSMAVDTAFHSHGHPEDAYAASLWGGSIGGMVVGILVIVLMSLPLCCGVLKQYGKAGKISGATSWVGP